MRYGAAAALAFLVAVGLVVATHASEASSDTPPPVRIIDTDAPTLWHAAGTGCVFWIRGTGTDFGPAGNAWGSYNLSPCGVPAQARYALLSGLLIITHGTTPQVCDLRVSFRRPNVFGTPDPSTPGVYVMQTVEGSLDGGQRSNASAWVPVLDGRIDTFITHTTPIGWPSWCSYGLNLRAEAWA